jgi:hypothetical protein
VSPYLEIVLLIFALAGWYRAAVWKNRMLMSEWHEKLAQNDWNFSNVHWGGRQ